MDSAGELIKKLGESDDYFERQKAAWALVGLGEEAVDVLIGALKNGEFSDLRYKSAWALGKIGSTRGLEPLAEAMLSDPDHVVREWSAAALEAMKNPGAVPYLAKAMREDSTRDVRLRAAMALRSLGAEAAFMEILNDADPDVRGMAITGLAKLRCAAAVEAVACQLDDPDAEVRRRVVAFMGDIGIEDVLDHLARAAKDAEPVVREEALKSLAHVKGGRACGIAAQALKDGVANVRYTAVTALGEIGHPDALMPLVEVMFGDDEADIRAWAAWSLGEIRDERAVEHLRRACDVCPTAVKQKAWDSLREVFGIDR